MTETTAMITRDRAELAEVDILDAFAAFLRLNVAQGDASPETIRSYHAHAGQFVSWCGDHGIDPTTATEGDLELKEPSSCHGLRHSFLISPILVSRAPKPSLVASTTQKNDGPEHSASQGGVFVCLEAGVLLGADAQR